MPTIIDKIDPAMLDRLIDNAYARMMAASNEDGQRYWCDRLTHWCKQRSPEQVQQMEREKGLA